jgi:hypothetical protein
LSDGTYDIADLVAVNRVLDIQEENKRRAHEHALEQQRNAR